MKKEVAQRIIKENRQVYNRIATQFSQTRSRPWGEFTVFRPYVKSGDQVLDIGCGNGRLYGYLQDVGIEYTGVDISESLIAKAQHLHPRAQFQIAPTHQLPFQDNHFDDVFIIATLHHIPSRALREKTLREAHRVLRPGGTLMMTEWNLLHRQWWNLLLRYSWRKLSGRSDLDWGDIEKPWKNNRGEIQGKRFLHLFTRHSLQHTLSAAGFTDIQQQYTTHGSPAPWHQAYNLLTIAQKR